MMVSDFDYDLPSELIAQSPVSPRDHARLVVVDRKNNRLVHRRFFDIIEYFKKGDVLILNDSTVIPARLLGKKTSGGKVEIFLSKPFLDSSQDEKKERTGKKKARLEKGKAKNETWECLIKGKHIRPGSEVIFSPHFKAIVEEKIKEVWRVSFNMNGKKFRDALEKYGQTPLPPYIKTQSKSTRKQYQTVYADKTKNGSVAAPTAGLHFTPGLLRKLKQKGVIIKTVTLHVGLGTFLPIRVTDPKKHRMHSEWVTVDKEVKKEIQNARKRNNKVFAVGTTTARSLEAAFRENKKADFFKKDFVDSVDIFLYPPYTFKAIDGLITNFHLPKSTLLMLVSAFAGRKEILRVYKEAVKEKYRFFSFGDAMLIM